MLKILFAKEVDLRINKMLDSNNICPNAALAVMAKTNSILVIM
jgi:hypothetical protein